MCEDENVNIEIALQWVINLKNYLIKCSWFSFLLPNIFINKLPALEEPNISKLIADNVNAMHSARHPFVTSESSEKLTRALKHDLRTYQDNKIPYLLLVMWYSAL